MLSDKDREWLEKRAVESCETCRDPDELFCSLCSRDPRPKSLSADFFSMSGCAMTTNWQEAAEFEARVASHLARARLLPCAGRGGECIERDISMTCEECTIKHARLVVEAKMEQEGE